MNEPNKTALVIIILMVIGLVAYAFERLAETVGKWWLMLAGISFAVLILRWLVVDAIA